MTGPREWDHAQGLPGLSYADVGAEQAALGSILTSTDPTATAARVFTIAAAAEFWRERALAEVLESMWRAGRPIDPQLLLAELTTAGLVVKLGGGPHIHDLMQRAWVPVNAHYYADAVHEAFRRRSLSQAAVRAAQSSENPAADVTETALELMGAAEEIFNAGRVQTVDAPADVLDFVHGPSAYDWQVPGLIERLDRIMITASEGLGKAIAWDTPIPTPKGWRLVAELSVGDDVFAPDGQPTKVVAATEVMLGRACSEVVFSDGARIVADDDHLWLTESALGRQQHPPRSALSTTSEIRDTLKDRDGFVLNHAVPVCQPLTYPTVELPLDPYVLGAWLGDGDSRSAQIASADEEITDRIRAAGYPCRRLTGRFAWSLSTGDKSGPRAGRVLADLRALGVYRNKHIPRAYLESSVDQRLALLQGLMDTDGTVNVPKARGRGSGSWATYSSISRRLVEDVYELVTGLGIKTTIRSRRATLNGRDIGPDYRVTFSTALPVFHLGRKAERLQAPITRRPGLRYVAAVESVASVPVRCIQVERPDGMYLAGRACIPTHNSLILAQIALAISVGRDPFTNVEIEPHRALVVDCEVSPRQQRRRWKWLLDVAETLGCPLKPEMLRVDPRPDGLDLTGKDLDWLKGRVRASGADVVVIGPLYRLHRRNINDEEVARELVGALDEIRVGCGCAMLIEAHAGHGMFGKERDLRPRGSSLFMGWSEFGIALRPVKNNPQIVDVLRWRGDRDKRTWPTRLRWGAGGLTWPWVEAAPNEGDTWG